MDTLLRAGTIRSVKEVWWDIRPHPGCGTVKIRMVDSALTPQEVGMPAELVTEFAEDRFAVPWEASHAGP
jgi:carboxylate-amine ligase